MAELVTLFGEPLFNHLQTTFWRWAQLIDVGCGRDELQELPL